MAARSSGGMDQEAIATATGNTIPADTDDLIVVQALSARLSEPIGTIVVKSVFDTAFPHRLKGVIDANMYLVRILADSIEMDAQESQKEPIFIGLVLFRSSPPLLFPRF
jgi:hypothetical protein